MSQGFTPTHALLDLLLELLSWPCMPNYDIVRIAVTTLSLFRFRFRFPFPFSVSTFRFHFPFPPFTVAQVMVLLLGAHYINYASLPILL